MSVEQAIQMDQYEPNSAAPEKEEIHNRHFQPEVEQSVDIDMNEDSGFSDENVFTDPFVTNQSLDPLENALQRAKDVSVPIDIT